MEQPPIEDDAAVHQPTPASRSSESPTAAPPAPAANRGPWILVVVVVAALATTNVVLSMRVGDLRSEVEEGFSAVDRDVSDIAGSVSRLAGSVGDVSARVDAFGGQLDNLNALALAGSGASSSPDPQGTQASAGLPRYDPAVQDPALGMVVGALAGPEYYTGETLEIDAADGKARAWLIWAHWCPFCQEEMPDLKAWAEANAASFTNFELVSLTTAMDESRGNPLVPYLDELQLPFPVIVDDDGALSAQFGLNAFPFWVFTGPDGTVLGRSAGLLGQEQFISIFEQLEDIGANA